MPSPNKLNDLMNRPPTDVVGLDCATSGVRAVRMKKTANGYSVTGAEVLPPAPVHAVMDAEDGEMPEGLDVLALSPRVRGRYAALLVPGVDVQLGDDEGVVEPVVVAPGAQIGLHDGGPPVGAVVGHAVDEAGQAAPGGRAEGPGTGKAHVAQHDLPAHRHLVGSETERHRLHRQRLVDVAGEVEGADHDVVGL